MAKCGRVTPLILATSGRQYGGEPILPTPSPEVQMRFSPAHSRTRHPSSCGTGRARRSRSRLGGCAQLLAWPALLLTTSAHANNYGESLAWQFRSSADQANQAAVLDLIAKRRGGYYAAPIYNTTIAHQVNCSIAATATGNSEGQSAVANAPTTNGAASSATGNSNTTTTGGGRAGSDIASDQTNSGQVGATVIGSTSSSVQGTAWQALNSEQNNSGNQSASVGGSTACAFGALN